MTDTSIPDVVGQIVLLRPDQIDASSRLLPVDPVWAAALAAMMKTDGQLTPIEVCRLPGRSDYTLVTGAHRHAAAMANESYLRAEVITNDAAQRRLREASENINRRTLAPYDRAKAVAELVAVQKAAAGLSLEQDGRAVSAAVRWQKDLEKEADDASEMISLAYAWADDAAERAGVTRRTIYSDLALLRGIPASIIETLRRKDHPAFHSAGQLKALAGLDEGEQRKVLGLLIHADMQIKGAPFDKVTDAIAAMRGKEPPRPDAKRLSAFVGSFARMPITEKRGALHELRAQLPKGWRLVEGEDKPAAPAFSPEHVRYREETLAAIDAMRELIGGLDEDELLERLGERGSALVKASMGLQRARFAVVSNAFDLGGQ